MVKGRVRHHSTPIDKSLISVFILIRMIVNFDSLFSTAAGNSGRQGSPGAVVGKLELVDRLVQRDRNQVGELLGTPQRVLVLLGILELERLGRPS